MACAFLTLHAAKKWTVHCWWLYDKERGLICGETHNFCGWRYISLLFHVLFHGRIVFHSFSFLYVVKGIGVLYFNF